MPTFRRNRMKVYKTNLYFTNVGFVSADYSTDAQQVAENIGSIYVYKDGEDYKEVTSDISIPVYIKADNEDLYFPHPCDYFGIMEEVKKYKFSLHIRECDLIETNKQDFQKENIQEINEECYPFFKYQQLKHELAEANEVQSKIQQKLSNKRK